jgi:serine/threonine protein kinase
MQPATQATMRQPPPKDQPPPKEKSKTPNSSRSTSTSSRGEGKFLAGTVLNDRYRVTGLLGRGGMGEVYKAEDLKLNQTVALKFLPEHFAEDPAARERFFGEVRTARQVSHSNVCRVFDIGEVDGAQFLSMEFIDGDDLSSLLRRIGRLPPDKALETARQLCAGLHAVHQAGILHRDFKPANVMIDGRGKARLTDFGIAGLESELKDGSVAGTPAYMSPEQITGKELSTKSDIYSLGLVLYEIFTGKPAFAGDTINELLRKHKTATPTTPSEVVKDIDPIVEQVILRCLEKDPRERPTSALQVAMMLPGGNPLEAAIAAGETPSPEMVAAAPKKGALKPIVAVALLAAVFVFPGLEVLLSKRAYVHRMVPLEKSSEVLSERSRELAKNFGYPSFDSQYGFTRDTDYLRYIQENDKTPTRWQKLATGQPAVMQFWYRSSPEPLIPVSGGAVWIGDPPNDISGMAQVLLDTKGRLIFFAGVPPRVDEAGGATKDFDWGTVFKEAGFDLAAFQPAESQWTPRREFDERRAWTGKYPEQPDIAIRVEAAAYRGKLVRFEIVEPWSKPAGQPTNQVGSNLASSIFIAIFLEVLIGSALLAIRNVRSGRSDLRGAFRLTLFFFALHMIRWAFEAHHVASAIGEIVLLITGGLQTALSSACFVGLMYLGFEPYLRKHAPERVISWNRLLAGDWRDPLVGRDVLIGLAAAAILIGLASLNHSAGLWLGYPPSDPAPTQSSLLGIRGFPVLFVNQINRALVNAFMVSFLVLFFSLLLRRKWLGNIAAWLIITVPFLLDSIGEGIQFHWLAFGVLFSTFVVFVVARFGVLASVSGLFLLTRTFYPLTTELSAWYAGDFVLFVVVLAALAIYGFYTSLAGQRLFKGKLLED